MASHRRNQNQPRAPIGVLNRELERRRTAARQAHDSLKFLGKILGATTYAGHSITRRSEICRPLGHPSACRIVTKKEAAQALPRRQRSASVRKDVRSEQEGNSEAR